MSIRTYHQHQIPVSPIARRRMRFKLTAAAAITTAAMFLGIAPAQADLSEFNVYEDLGRCERAFPGQEITSSSITAFSCELTCGVNGVSRVVEVQDCQAARVLRPGELSVSTNESALAEFEYQAVLDIIEQHELPGDDMDKIRRVLTFARGDVRSRMYVELAEIASMDPGLRTDKEQVVAEIYADRLQDLRVEAIEFSIAEYQEWEFTGCDYVPPAPFTYEPDIIACDGGWTPADLFVSVFPPTFEEFLEYGVAHTSSPLLEGSAPIAVVEAARGTTFVAAAVALGIATVTGVVSAATIIVAVKLILPFAGQTILVAGAAAGSAIAAVVLTVVGPVLIVVLAVFVAILQGYFVFSSAEIPDRLQEALEQAESERPALIEIVSTEDGPFELFTVFMRSTLPTLPDINLPDPPEAGWLATIPATSNTKFEVTELDINLDPIPGTETIVDQIDYMPWSDDPARQANQGIPTSFARLAAGYFVPSFELEDEPITTMRLYIERMGGDNTDWVTWVAGDMFIHHQRDSDPEVTGISSDTMFFWNHDRQPRLARILRDDTPPVIVAHLDGDEGANGWFTSAVDVEWSVTDPDSAITRRQGCQDTTLGAASDVIHLISCVAESLGGEATESVAVRIDATPPNIAASVSPPANDAAWHKTDASVSFTCSDYGISGQDTTATGGGCGPDTVVSEETPSSGVEVVGAATDKAGNARSTAVTVKLDKTAPSIIESIAPNANDHGWNNTNVEVSFECVDALSGVASCTPTTTLSEETTIPKGMVGNAKDNAGNIGFVRVRPIKIDKTPPAIVALASPGPNVNGWNNADVTIAYSCSDALSGVLNCSGPDTLSSEGAGQSATGVAEDHANNAATATKGGVNIDKSDPVVAIASPSTTIPEYLQYQLVYAEWAADDGISGLDGVTATAANGAPIDTSVSGEHVFRVAATDLAGNATSVTHTYVVLSPSDSIELLAGEIAELVENAGLKSGQSKGLLRTLDNAVRSIARGKVDASCSQLRDFADEVDAKSPNPINAATAAELIAYASNIATVSLGCASF